jgi:WD40 repeat protein
VHTTSYIYSQILKCFAWSPDPALDDLIAVGQGTGKIDLFRLEASKYANRNNILSTGPTVTLPVRNSRSCNSLAFCNVDTNYLAVGLDKVRGDCSLLIWDITATSAILSIAPGSHQYQHLDTEVHNHIQIQPAPGTHRPQPQIPRADLGPRVHPRVLQQHAPTETVSSVCFLPQSTHLLLAGISSRWLRLFDLRSAIPSTTNVPSKVQGIVTDPFDPHRIACFGDCMVTVWDARKLSLPLLSFDERDAAADGPRARTGQSGEYGGIEFSSTRRGMLASLEKDASYVRFWDMMGAQPHLYTFDDTVLDGSKAGKVGRRSWANLPWPAGQHRDQTPPSPKESSEGALGSMVLHDTRRSTSARFPIPPS